MSADGGSYLIHDNRVDLVFFFYFLCHIICIFFAVAMTDKDEVNMISAVLAKQMGAKETIVRVRNPEYSNAYFKDKNFLGFSTHFNTS